MPFRDLDREFMEIALHEAARAAERGEVPVGAVIVGAGDDVIARGSNRVIEDADPTAHAEIVVLRRAARVIGNYRLEGLTLYTTLEPCLMCYGAAVHARIARLVYASSDPKAGALSAGFEGLNHRFELVAGVEQARASSMLVEFFRERRASTADKQT